MRFSLAMLFLVRTNSLNARFVFSQVARRFSSSGMMMSDSGPSSQSGFTTIGITGAAGLVGTALRDELSRRETLLGKPIRIVRLSRGEKAEKKALAEDNASETSLIWNPNGSTAAEVIDLDALAAMDAVIHLAGENVATGLGPLGFLGLRPWTDKKKAEILNSRVIPTRALSMAIAAVEARPQTFLVASGIGVYGDHFIGDSVEAVDESMNTDAVGGFLARVSREWEAATGAASGAGKKRVVNMRFGVVLSRRGGALQKLYPIFYLGGGGNVGSGQQYFSYISARDLARAIVHALETPSLEGPANFSSPEPCTNAEFTKAFGKVLGRPTIIPLPSFAVSLLFGEMGDEMLLGGVRAKPTKLTASGFTFLHPTIEPALRSAVEETI